MGGYSSIAWLPLAAGLTVLGLVLSVLVFRRRGLRPAVLATAWSLLPIAAYMTGSIEMLWKIGVAIGQFGTGFVFSPLKWAGIGVTGLAIALFLAAGGRERRRAARDARKAARARSQAEAEAPSAPSALTGRHAPEAAARARPADRSLVPADRKAAARNQPPQARKQAPPEDDDLKDIEEILRKRGL